MKTFAALVIASFCCLKLAAGELKKPVELLPFQNRQHREECLDCKGYTNTIEALIQDELKQSRELTLASNLFCKFVGVTEGQDAACKAVGKAIVPKIFTGLLPKLSAGHVCSDLMQCGAYKRTEPTLFKDFEDYPVPADKIDIYDNGKLLRGEDFECSVCVESLTYLKPLLADGRVASAAVLGADKLCDLYKGNPIASNVCKVVAAKVIPWFLKTVIAPLNPDATCRKLMLCKDGIASPSKKQSHCAQCNYAIEHVKPLLLRSTAPLKPIHVCGSMGVWDVKGYAVNDCIKTFLQIREHIGKTLSASLQASAICAQLCTAADSVKSDVELVTYSDHMPKINIIDGYVDACNNLVNYARAKLATPELQDTAKAAMRRACQTLDPETQKQCESWINEFGLQIAAKFSGYLNNDKICIRSLRLDRRSNVWGQLYDEAKDGLQEIVSSGDRFFSEMFQ